MTKSVQPGKLVPPPLVVTVRIYLVMFQQLALQQQMLSHHACSEDWHSIHGMFLQPFNHNVGTYGHDNDGHAHIKDCLSHERP